MYGIVSLVSQEHRGNARKMGISRYISHFKLLWRVAKFPQSGKKRHNFFMFDLGQLGYFAVSFLRTLQNRSNPLRTAERTLISQSAINQNKPNILLRVQRRIQAQSLRRSYFSVNLEEREQD